MKKLEGKHVLITGASSGIGRAFAFKAAKNGAIITAIARRENELKKLIDELNLITGNRHQFLTLDLTEFDNIALQIKNISSIDVLVHCAGIVSPLPVKFIKNKHIDSIFPINTYAPMILTAELLSANKIKIDSSIIFISSISTQFPYFGGALYVSSKAALEAYARTLALELAPKKIRCNILSPALVKTDIYELTVANYTEQELKTYEQKYPLGFGEADDVANAILFFSSEDSKWITGQNLILDGGLTLNNK